MHWLGLQCVIVAFSGFVITLKKRIEQEETLKFEFMITNQEDATITHCRPTKGIVNHSALGSSAV